MKNISISLTDQHAALIEAAVASGDYASASEVVRTALRELFQVDLLPEVDVMVAEIDAMDREIAAGRSLLAVDEVRAEIARHRR
ncbi:MAG: ribbon-helix-helix domain-containing protein [Pseudomonadota bacterium]